MNIVAHHPNKGRFNEFISTRHVTKCISFTFERIAELNVIWHKMANLMVFGTKWQIKWYLFQNGKFNGIFHKMTNSMIFGTK